MLFNFKGLLSQAFELFSEPIWTLNIIVFFMHKFGIKFSGNFTHLDNCLRLWSK
jgi:hypothetical protein